MPRLKDLMGGTGKVSPGNAAITLSKPGNRTLGGILITTDGTNAATVTIRKTNGSGDIIFDITTTASMFVGMPLECTDIVHWTLSGTGSGLQLFEWIPYRGGRD